MSIDEKFILGEIFSSLSKENDMALKSARNFFEQVKSNEFLFNKLTLAKSKNHRRQLLLDEGFNFTREEFLLAKSELSDWELTMIEDESSFRSDKRVSGLEFCCCCGVAGTVKEDVM